MVPPSTSGPPPSTTTGQVAQVLAVATGGIAVLGIFILVGMQRLAPSEGLPWILTTLSGLAHLRNGNSAAGKR
jgi:hypothetical protein